MKRLIPVLAVGLLALRPGSASAQPCNQGLPTGNLTGVVNTYYPGVGTAAAGATTITVDTSAIRGASTTADIVIGDMLLVVQTQDAEFNQDNDTDYGDGAGGTYTGAGSTALNNTGRYEYVVAQSAVSGGGVVTIRGAGGLPGAPNNGLVFSYTTAARDDNGATRRGQRTFQVVRVSRRASATLVTGLTAAAWDGRTGGVLAVDVAGNLALNGATATVSGLGFRGGVGVGGTGQAGLTQTDFRITDGNDADGRKGEGIACTPDVLSAVPGGSGTDGCPRGDRARGAPGNAGGGGVDGDPSADGTRCNGGGNDENTGGGGGGNGGTGGQGGNGWNPNTQTCTAPNAPALSGGIGAASFPATAALLAMGGGGGAGTSNNVGPANGAAGGGMMFVRAGSVSGTGTFNASGAAAVCSGQDGAGGGGAGGSVLVYAESGVLTGLTVTATGGRGGDGDFGTNGATNCNLSGTPHGPGGGGGGGVVFGSGALNAASSVAGGQSGRTTGNIAYGSVAGGNGPAITTSLTAGQITGVQACTVATRASLGGLRVTPGLVEFATVSQRDTIAFRVYATADVAGRTRRLLTPRAVPAPLPDTQDAVLYRARVGTFREPFVMIEEIERSGRARRLGPFPRRDETLRAAFEQIVARSAREATRTVLGAVVLGGRSLAPAPRRVALGVGSVDPTARPMGVKVETRGAGTATVLLTDLVAGGLPQEHAATPEALRVFHFGAPAPHTLVTDAGGAVVGLRFAVGALSTDFTDRDPYVVWRSEQAPPAPRVPFTRSGPPLPDGWQRVQQNQFYAPFVHPDADPWIWDFLITGEPALTRTFDLPPLASGPDPVPVRVHFAGSSDHRHLVRAVLNGIALDEAHFHGRMPGVLKGAIPRALLRATGNELTLTYTVEDPRPIVGVGVAFLDAVDLGIAPAPSRGAPAAVARIAPYDPRVPDLSDVDDLVLTHADFAAAAERLAARHQAQGLRTKVIAVERAYDAFAGGALEAQAVRALLQRLPVGASVVLFGDDTLDPRDYLGLGSVAYVPSLQSWDGQFGRVASENRYADQGDDGIPELAIGRLPASTPLQAEQLVDKIERGSPPVGPGSTQLIAVDDQGESDVSFAGLGARIAAPLPLGEPRWADVSGGIEEARAALRDAWRAGPVVAQYFGHGAPDAWADERLLTTADAPALDGIGPAPLLFTWTCQAQWYQYHLGPSVNEALLLVPDGGALASVGPTGIADPSIQATLAERVLAAVVDGMRLGDAVRKAKSETASEGPEARKVVEGFTLLGDPTLVIGGLSSRPDARP